MSSLQHAQSLQLFKLTMDDLYLSVFRYTAAVDFIGRLFVKWFALSCRTIVLSVLSCLSVTLTKRWMDQDETWHGGRPRPRSHCVRWGPSSPPKKRGTAPRQYSAHVCCGQTTRWIKMPLGMDVDLDPGNIVLDEDPAPPTFQSMSIVAKQLDGSRCHLLRR